MPVQWLLNSKTHLLQWQCSLDAVWTFIPTPRSYTLYLLNQGKNLNGYIALTEGLNDLFNENGKPSIILEGIVEDLETKPVPNKYGKYFFFG